MFSNLIAPSSAKKNALNSRLEEGRQQLEALRAQHATGAERLAQMQATLDERRQANEKLAADLEAFRKRMAESEFAGTVKELQALVALNEELKTHMSQFEESCRRQAEGENFDSSLYLSTNMSCRTSAKGFGNARWRG